MYKKLLSAFLTVLVLMLFVCTAMAASCTFEKTDYSAFTGKSYRLKLVTDGVARSDVRNAVWKSSDPSVASVDKYGKVQALQDGEAEIFCTIISGGEALTATAHFQVVRPVSRIIAANPSVKLVEGATWTQSITIQPADATITALDWSSTDESVATVSEDGVIRGVGLGKCVIVGTARDGSGKSIRIPTAVKEFDVVVRYPGGKNMDLKVLRADDFRKAAWTNNGLVTVTEIDSNTIHLTPVAPGADTLTIRLTNSRGYKNLYKFTVYVTQYAVDNLPEAEDSDEEIEWLDASSDAEFLEEIAAAEEAEADEDDEDKPQSLFIYGNDDEEETPTPNPEATPAPEGSLG